MVESDTAISLSDFLEKQFLAQCALENNRAAAEACHKEWHRNGVTHITEAIMQRQAHENDKDSYSEVLAQVAVATHAVALEWRLISLLSSVDEGRRSEIRSQFAEAMHVVRIMADADRTVASSPQVWVADKIAMFDGWAAKVKELSSVPVNRPLSTPETKAPRAGEEGPAEIPEECPEGWEDTTRKTKRGKKRK
jgi:hypothetical protein